ncbi:hypothetical protein [Saccharopolyspora spinosa]|uniref:hypothetical protein n=1 Tax=Saccharopolyspora spinosa TaxID=60894 RepID=UPI00374849F3
MNQAGYFFGDARFRVNCLEACVAFHNSVKFGRQFVAGPAGADRDPVRLEVAFGRQVRRVGVLLGLSGMWVVGRWGWLCRCCISGPTVVRM